MKIRKLGRTDRQPQVILDSNSTRMVPHLALCMQVRDTCDLCLKLGRAGQLVSK